jgi:DNA gyrase subunit B
MPELIQHGYLYIAQPPLLRIGKGKKAVYLTDETQLNDHLLRRVCENISIQNEMHDRALKNHHLFLFMTELSEYFLLLEKMERKLYPPKLVETLIKTGVTGKDYLKDREKMVYLKEVIEKQGYRTDEVRRNEERDIYEFTVFPQVRENETESVVFQDLDKAPVIIGRGLIFSNDYQKCLLKSKGVLRFDHPPFVIKNHQKQDQEVVLESKAELLSHIMEEGKKGLVIQRYKGLGEMNPDQLWETTMDPETRNLLQVRVEDVLDTDEIFTILMGEDVEQRRDFIQSNALEVSMLDI